MAAGLVVAGANTGVVSAAPPANSDNVRICHRTHSVTNPYVLITVDQRSVGNANSKHGGGAHDYWATTVYATKPSPNVYNPAKTYPANDKKWGDIIAFADVSGNPLTGSAANVAGLNNTGIGAQIFNGTGIYAGLCRSMNARDYYEVERSAGVPPTDILADMNELDSPDFASALSACGGTFTGCNPSSLGNTSISIPTTTTTTTIAGATTTSTVAGKSTTATTVFSASNLEPGKGALRVRIWIDSTRDGKKAGTEPFLPGITVTITGPGGVTKTVKTDANGDALFVNLDPGQWTIESVLDVDGLEKVYDKDGTVDWKSTQTVVAGQVAEDEFAAAGDSTFEVTQVTAKKVKIIWSGLDDEFDTDDDASFVLESSGGKVRAQGLPGGKYKVTALSDSAVLVTVTLPSGEEVVVAAVSLDRTGFAGTGPLVALAFMLMVAGTAIAGARRRRLSRI